jgi:hypothetical protein
MPVTPDVFLSSGDAAHAQSAQNQLTHETAELILEILRLMRLNQQAEDNNLIRQRAILVVDGEILPESTRELSSRPDLAQLQGRSTPAISPKSEEPPISGGSPRLQIPGNEPIIEPEILPDDHIDLLQMAEHLSANAASQLVNQFGKQGIYRAENYTIQAQDEIYHVYDVRQREILQFRERTIDDYQIIENNLSKEQLQDLLKVKLTIEDEGLANIMADTTFAQQVEKLGSLAPDGSQAAWVANYFLEGYATDQVQFQKYSFNRDSQGNITITRDGSGEMTDKSTVGDVRATQDLTQNPAGHVALRSAEGHILESNLTTQEKYGFAQVHQFAKEHPLGADRQMIQSVSEHVLD